MVVANILGVDTIWVVLIALVVLFGGSQLPKLARNVGLAGKEFRKAHDEVEHGHEAPAPPASPAVPPAVSAGPVATAPEPASAGGAAADKVTLSKTELEALLDEREQRGKRQASS